MKNSKLFMQIKLNHVLEPRRSNFDAYGGFFISNSTKHDLVPPFNRLPNLNEFDFTNMEVSDRNYFMQTRHETPLDNQKAKNPLKPTVAWKS